MKNSKKLVFLAFLAAMTVFESCVKDIDRAPVYDISSTEVYSKFVNYQGIIAKAYAGLAVTGQ